MGRKHTEETKRKIGRGVSKTATKKRETRQRLESEDRLVGVFQDGTRTEYNRPSNFGQQTRSGE